MGKKQIVVDSSGNPVECFTLAKSAKMLGLTKEELKLYLYRKNKRLPYYKVVNKHGKRLIRITKADVDHMRQYLEGLEKCDEVFAIVARKIRKARMEMPVMRIGMSQKELAKQIKMSLPLIAGVEYQKFSPSIKTLGKIARTLDKPLEYFLTDD